MVQFLCLLLISVSPSYAAVDLNPNSESSAEVKYDEAIAVAAAGDSDRALVLYTEVVTLDPTLEIAFVNRASLYADRNENKNAICDLKSAIALDPSDWMAWNNLGNSLTAIGKFSAAVSAFSNALELKTDLPVIWRGRGHAREKLGQLKKAEIDFSRAIEVSNSTSADDFANRGLMRVKRGKIELGKHDLEQALRLDPSQPVARKILEILKREHI